MSGLNFRGIKLSRMAIDPRKLLKFNSAKVKAYTVLVSHGINYNNKYVNFTVGQA